MAGAIGAAEATGGQIVKPAPTSEKLEQLRAELKTLKLAAKSAASDSPEEEDAMLAVWKQNQLIKAEVANIEKAAKEAEVEAKRQKQIELRINYKAAVLANDGKKATAETAEAEKLAQDALDNQLLARFSSAAPAKKAADGTQKEVGERGATAKRITEMFLANRAAGMNDTDNKKAIVAAGESRGTTGAVVLAWQQANGEK